MKMAVRKKNNKGNCISRSDQLSVNVLLAEPKNILSESM